MVGERLRNITIHLRGAKRACDPPVVEDLHDGVLSCDECLRGGDGAGENALGSVDTLVAEELVEEALFQLSSDVVHLSRVSSEGSFHDIDVPCVWVDS